MAASTITPCIFTDRIPPEIRKMIFDHVLIRPEPFKFYRVFSPIQRVDGKRKGRWIAGKDTLGTKYAGLAYSRRAQAWVPKKPRHTALLQTCSTFHAEAVEVFYGSNSFVFSTSTEAMRVVESFGHAKASIRKIFIWDYVRYSAGNLWKSFLSLVKLRSVSISHGCICQKQPPGERLRLSLLGRQMLPLLKVLQTSYAAQRLPIHAVDVLEIRSQPCVYCCCICTERDMGRVCRCLVTEEGSAAGQFELVRDVRAALSKALADPGT